jgi:hypothetical protein
MNILSFSIEYPLTKFSQRFESLHLVTGHKIKTKEDIILNELRKLEEKVADKEASFTEKDLINFIQLIENVNNLRKSVKSPEVYWLSRMGR